MTIVKNFFNTFGVFNVLACPTKHGRAFHFTIIFSIMQKPIIMVNKLLISCIGNIAFDIDYILPNRIAFIQDPFYHHTKKLGGSSDTISEIYVA